MLNIELKVDLYRKRLAKIVSAAYPCSIPLDVIVDYVKVDF